MKKQKYAAQEEQPLLSMEDSYDLKENASDSKKKKQQNRNEFGTGKYPTSPGFTGFGASPQAATPVISLGNEKSQKPQKQPNRTTKASQKLVVFPESYLSEARVTDLASDYGDGLDEKVVEYPYDIAKEKEAERLKKVDKKGLPRVTAYCTAK